jgi:UDP-N-acetylglucosamine 3-dehydrogenase
MTLKVAVIGVGAMGKNHVRIYWELPNLDFVGIADSDKDLGESISKRYGVDYFQDFRKLLDTRKPDAVTIAVPTANHFDVALEAIQRGIHVLIEKPIAPSIEQGEKIIQAAQQHQVKLMIGHVERFNPAVVALKEKIQAGKIGKVFQLDARREGPFPARISDVGVVIDLSVHDIDIMRSVSGSEVVRVYAETEQRIHTKHEDLLTGLLRFEDKSVGTLNVNWLTPTKIRELHITGEMGLFKVDYLTQDLYFFENTGAQGSDWDTLRVLRGVNEGSTIKYALVKKEPLRSEQEAFIAAVNGESSIAVTGEDGLKALKIAEAIVLSGQEHRMVSLR